MTTEPIKLGEMEGRVGRLEALTGESRQDMREIRADLKAIIGRLGSMPTKTDLETWNVAIGARERCALRGRRRLDRRRPRLARSPLG